MKKIIITLLLIAAMVVSCKPAELRINECSYTEYWYYENDIKYQVYKTRNCNMYILVLNKKQTKYIRKFVFLNKQ